MSKQQSSRSNQPPGQPHPIEPPPSPQPPLPAHFCDDDITLPNHRDAVKDYFPILCLRGKEEKSYDWLAIGRTEKRNELKQELARRIIAWEGSSTRANEFAEELIDLFGRYQSESALGDERKAES